MWKGRRERGCTGLGRGGLRATVRYLLFSEWNHWRVWAEETGVEAQERPVMWGRWLWSGCMEGRPGRVCSWTGLDSCLVTCIYHVDG